MQTKDSRLSQACQSFFYAVMNGSFQELVSAVYEIFHYPVLIHNDVCQCICQIPYEAIGDPDWDYTFEHGCCSDELFHLFYEKYFRHITTYDFPILISDGFRSDHPQYISSLHQNGRLVGYTAFLTTGDPLGEDDIEIIKAFNRAAKHLLLQQEMTQNISNRSTYLLREVIGSNRPSSFDELPEDNELRMAIAAPYQILVCSSDLPLQRSNHLCMEIMQTGPYSVAIYFDGNIVVLQGNLLDPDFSDRMDRTAALLEKYHLQGSLSSTFQVLSTENIKSYYQQAVLTQQCAKKAPASGTLSCYQTYAPMQIFQGMRNSMDVSAFIYPKIHQIREYDAANETSYYDTLKAYLSNMKNSKLAAKQLYVHPNTILYRVRRLEELFSISFEDEQENLLLLLGCLLLDS